MSVTNAVAALAETAREAVRAAAIATEATFFIFITISSFQ